MFYNFFNIQVWHWANLNRKDENNASNIRCHEITVTILQIGTPDKRKTRKGFGFRISSTMSYTAAGRKKWRHASKNVAIVHFFFFFFFFTFGTYSILMQ